MESSFFLDPIYEQQISCQIVDFKPALILTLGHMTVSLIHCELCLSSTLLVLQLAPSS